jgi:hypothetical protein
MLAILAAAGLICAASLIAGRALFVAFGRREWTWLSGPVGLAALVVVAQPLVRLPGRGTTAAVALAVALVACLVYLRGRWQGPALRELAREVLPVAAIVVAAASLPFLLQERVGVLGEGYYTNDHAAQLYWAEWLRDGFGPEPAGVALGYPLGPQSLMAALSAATGISVEAAFNGLLFAVAVLTGLTALTVLGRLRPLLRVPGAALVALPYLAAAFLTQSGFKETLMALFLTAFALALRDLVPRSLRDPRELLPSRRDARRATLVALGVLVGGCVFTYSVPGLIWPTAAAAVWLAAEIATGGLPRPRLDASLGRRALPVAGAAAAILALLAVTQLGALGNFLDRLGDVQNTGGRLDSPVSPREIFGVWPRGDFRIDESGSLLPALTTALGLAAVGFGAWWWVRRRDLAVPAAIAAAGVIYLLARWKGGLHVEAKALAIAAPLVMLLAVRALLEAKRPPGRARLALDALALAFVVVAAFSTFISLRAAPVGTTDRIADLRELLPIVEGDRVLYLVPDRFAPARLEGALVGSPGGYVPSQDIPARRAKRWDQGLPLDLDTVPDARMDKFRFAITTSADYQSLEQPNWQPTHVTPSYTLWRRFLGTPEHGVLDEEHGAPGAILDCDEPSGRALSKKDGTATVIPEPVVSDSWRPDPWFVTGGESTISLQLAPGRWNLSLQYHSPRGLRIEGAGLDKELPASLEGWFAFAPGEGPFWPAGELNVRRGEPVELTVAQQPLETYQRYLGVEHTTWLGEIAATRPGGGEEVPLSEACGRYVDWFTVEK